MRSPGMTAPELPFQLQSRGSSQGGLRQYNERVVLQAIRLHGAVPAAELARLTHLTAQTISLISKRLHEDGLLLKGEPVRGKVGQPSVPLSLNPEGAFAIGVKVGRRNLEVLLVDFTGQPRQRWSLGYEAADPDVVVPEIALRLREIRRKLGPERRQRLEGIGVAAPLAMHSWQSLLGASPALARKWESFDLAGAVARNTHLPVSTIKDTAAACVAELVLGRGRSVRNFLYVFVDTFVGGSLVLDSHLRLGLRGNAGAFGSLPLGRAGAAGPPPQLLSQASLVRLEQRFQAAGLDGNAALDERALQAPWLAHTEPWLAEAAEAIALGMHMAACLLDIEAAILDGAMGRGLLAQLAARVQQALGELDWSGVSPPQLMTGTVGSDAMALGGAMMPLYANYAPDRELFLKDEP